MKTVFLCCVFVCERWAVSFGVLKIICYNLFTAQSLSTSPIGAAKEAVSHTVVFVVVRLLCGSLVFWCKAKAMHATANVREVSFPRENGNNCSSQMYISDMAR